APEAPGHDTVLSAHALDFVAGLHENFADRLGGLMAKRGSRSAEMNEGTLPRFTPDYAAVRADRTWQVAGSQDAPGLEDRRVELAGPVTEPEVVRALNSQAKVWIADFEDSTSPTWANILGGQHALYLAVPDQLPGVSIRNQPTIGMRPRGWHLPEKHLMVTGDD
ncbi:malate synthase A, partial [Burkholderia multivorans]